MRAHTLFSHQESLADLGITDHAAFHVATSDGDPVYSDLLGYFTKVSPLPRALQFILFNGFLIQWMMASYLIPLKDFWRSSPTIFRAIELFSYIALVHAPDVSSPAFLPLLLILTSLYIFSTVVFIGIRGFYARHSYLPRWICYAFTLLFFFLHTLLLPTFFSFIGAYLNASFENYPPTSTSIGALVVIVMLWQTFDSLQYLLFQNCQIDLQAGLFLCRKPATAARLYFSLAFICFVSHVVMVSWRKDIVVSVLAFLVNSVNLGCELAQMSWLIRWQFSLAASVFLGGMVSTAYCFVATIVPSIENDPGGLILAALIAWTLGWVGFPFFHRAVVRFVLNRLSDPNYPRKVRSAFWVHRDFHLGLQFGHPAVLQSTFVSEILRRFPNDFELHLFLANFSLSCQTCPKTLVQLAEQVRPGKTYSPFRAHIFHALGRLLPPTGQSEQEDHIRQITHLNQLFSKLITAETQLYDMIFNEQAGGVIPEAALRFRYFYGHTVRHLTRFLEQYPGCPNGGTLIDVLESAHPYSPDLAELRKWHQYQPNYVDMAASSAPAHLFVRFHHPEIFRKYRPQYSETIMDVIPKLEPAASEGQKSLLANVIGPYESLLRRWYVLVFVIPPILLPIIIQSLVAVDGERRLIKMTQIIKNRDLIVRFNRALTYAHALILYGTSTEKWNEFSQGAVSLGTWKRSFASDLSGLQNDFIFLSTGFGGSDSLNEEVLRRTSTFYKSSSGGYPHSIALLSSTFMINELLSSDSAYLEQTNNVSSLMIILRGIEVLYDDCFAGLDLLLVDLAGNYSRAIAPQAALIGALCLLAIGMGVLWSVFKTAFTASHFFFMTLRETQKGPLGAVRQHLSGLRELRLFLPEDHDQPPERVRSFTLFRGFIFPILLMIGVMTGACSIHYSLDLCFERQLGRMFDLYVHATATYVKVSQALRSYQESRHRVLISDFNASRADDRIHHVLQTWSAYSPIWASPGGGICPLCDRRSIVLYQTSSGETWETAFSCWISRLSLMVGEEGNLISPLSLRVCADFYLNIDAKLIEWIDFVLLQNTGLLHQTTAGQMIAFAIYTATGFLFIILIFCRARQSDEPFYQTIQLLRRLPEEALPRDSLRILTERSWDFRLDSFQFDPGSYDDMVNALPDPVILIDRTRAILFSNHAAAVFFDENREIVGQNIFEAMTMELHETRNQALNLEYVVNEYLFEDRAAPVNYQMTGQKDSQVMWFSLTVFPVFDESPDHLPTQRHGADTWALIFHDISEQVRKQNLYLHENQKYRNMLHRILPGQIADRLMAGEPFVQMEVTKVAISFCDVVTFTPWCARTPAETVVNALNLMFTKFDECQAKYERVTKIKCIGDCYMSAAGVFLTDEETLVDTESPRQMLRFCLDCIDAMGVVNRAFPPPSDDKSAKPLQVRIGIHYGGPVSAGVMGIHRPVFDIWGETVNMAEGMESSGKPMMVHISREMYEKVMREPFDFELNPKDGSYFVRRIRDSSAGRKRRISTPRI